MNILVVFTGGTISCRLSGGAVAIDGAPYRLMEGIPEDEFRFDTLEALHILSENMTPEVLLDLFAKISGFLSGKTYDGMIIAHGTDTLAYTAQLAGRLLDGLGFPAVILGSKLPLENPANDGMPNFRNALRLIRQIRSGVYVVSRSADGIDYVHSARKVMQADSQTDDFQSYKGQYFGIMRDGVLSKNPGFRPDSEDSSRTGPDGLGDAGCPDGPGGLLPRLAALRENRPKDMTVLTLDACVGMDFRVLDLERPGFRYILQRLYHSGTACAAPRTSPHSLLFLQDLCAKAGKRLFIAPAESSRTPYSSTCELLEAGVTPLYDMPFEAAWAGLLLCSWLGEDPDMFF